MERKYNRSKGNKWEDYACSYLRERGVFIKDRNVKTYRSGEIDIVGIDEDGIWIFAEVKYRSSKAAGSAQEAVSFHKQQSICRAADFCRLKYHIPVSAGIRFDVIAINGRGRLAEPEVNWIRNAFAYIGKG